MKDEKDAGKNSGAEFNQDLKRADEQTRDAETPLTNSPSIHPSAFIPHPSSLPPVPWTSRDVWWGIASFGAWFALVLLFRLVIDYFSLNMDLGLLVTLGELLLLVPLWWLTGRKYGVGWKSLGLRNFKGVMVGLGCGLMLLSFAFNFAYSLFLALFNLTMQIDLTPLFAELSSPWLFFIGGALVAPLVEELFFRGFVFAGFRQKYGWQKAAAISSALFALLHLTPTAFIPIFILGYIFAALYHFSGSIWPGILMHVLTNSLALGAAYLVANAEKFGIPLG